MNEIRTEEQKNYSGERSLYRTENAIISNCVFENGESPLKECKNIGLNGDLFKWKYPLWYCDNVKMENCTLFSSARAGIWYTSHLSVANTVIEAPKTFRRCDDVALSGVTLTDAAETLWNCKNVNIRAVTAKGDYFAMNCEDVVADGLTLVGNYAFDGCKNVTVKNSTLLCKDAFWNCENVTVYDSFISGEYLGWNSRSLTLVNCTVESLQGLCYISGLTMRGCRTLNTTLAFEYSDVDAEICGRIDSVMNPSRGRIKADSIGTLILDERKVAPAATDIICPAVDVRLSHAEWET